MIGTLLVSHEALEARELTFEGGLADKLWEEMQKVPSLFTDLDAGVREYFDASVLDENSYWIGLYDTSNATMFGVLQLVRKNDFDYVIHILVFDKVLMDSARAMLCRELMGWFFANFPAPRLGVEVPELYRQTINFARMLGFKDEGKRRAIYLMRGKWRDEVLMSVTREEIV